MVGEFVTRFDWKPETRNGSLFLLDVVTDSLIGEEVVANHRRRGDFKKNRVADSGPGMPGAWGEDEDIAFVQDPVLVVHAHIQPAFNDEEGLVFVLVMVVGA